MKLRAALRKGGRGGDVARTRTRTTTNTTTTSSSSSSSSAGEAVLDNINNNEPKNDSDDSQKTTKVTSLLLRRIRRTRHVSLGGLIAMIMLMGTLIALSVPTSLSLSSSGQQQQQRQQQVHNNNKVDDSNFQTLTSIPKNQNLNCSHILSIVTTNLPPPRQQSEWRKPLWVPSFAGSGSAGPSGKGDIVKGLINGKEELRKFDCISCPRALCLGGSPRFVHAKREDGVVDITLFSYVLCVFVYSHQVHTPEQPSLMFFLSFSFSLCFSRALSLFLVCLYGTEKKSRDGTFGWK